jgi:hypothetical protein
MSGAEDNDTYAILLTVASSSSTAKEKDIRTLERKRCSVLNVKSVQVALLQ